MILSKKYLEIIKTIEKEHHKYLKEELPVIHDLIYTILKVHYSDSGKELQQVHKLFGVLKAELELIMVKRQICLYPAARDYNRENSDEFEKSLNEEAKDISIEYKIVKTVIEEMREVTNNYTMPPSGCPTFETTYRKLEELEENVLKSIETERSLYS